MIPATEPHAIAEQARGERSIGIWHYTEGRTRKAVKHFQTAFDLYGRVGAEDDAVGVLAMLMDCGRCKR